MPSPKISVIIGSYNCENLIEETVQSVIGQTFKDWELIIVDDCSPDTTLEKIKVINDKRIRIIALDENSGRPAIPRNVGIKNARGKYLAFLDHDDIWLPDKLYKQLDVMEKDKNIFLIYSKFFIQKDGKIGDIMPSNPKSGYVFTELFLSYNFIPCSTVMIRNPDTKDKYLFDEDKDVTALEDYALWLLIAYEERVFFIDEPLMIYRLHGQNASAGVFLFFKRLKVVIKKFGHMVPKHILLRKYISFYIRLFKSYLKFVLLPKCGLFIGKESDCAGVNVR